jgi:DNA-binding protein Fis
MSGGGGGMISRALGSQGPAQGGAQYSAPQAANPYQSAFNSQQGSQAPQTISPLVQQQMMRQQQGFNPMQQMMMRQQQQPMFNPMMQQSSGLQAAMMQMMGRQNQPMMRPQMQGMPQYRSPALGYRPDLANAQQSLNRVQPSVYKTDLDTARARIAELEAAQQPQQDPYYGGGG